MFTELDLKQIQKRGLSDNDVKKQIEKFRNGFPYMNIVRPATAGDGILQLNSRQEQEYIQLYEENKADSRFEKFVPASGAASRMFKALYAFINNNEAAFVKNISDMQRYNFDAVYEFFVNLEKFPFYKKLKDVIENNGHSFDQLLAESKYVTILEYLLEDHGLGYGKLPKGLIDFHGYRDFSRTPTEEHLVEAAHYCKTDNKARLHLTVSPEHYDGFRKHITDVKAEYEDKFDVAYLINFSEQKPSTDIIAVDLNNEPFRDGDGSILFRPGGHGALIQNLNALDADIIFIKNVDNVVPDKLKDTTYKYKKLLAGILIHYQKRIFSYLRQLNDNTEVSSDFLNEILGFLRDELHIVPSESLSSYTKDDTIRYLFNKLNRPIRVCGMVPNEGEPGGGPFWATNSDGTVSLQIVEKAQIDSDDPEQQKHLNNSTHFNSVDLVCGIKDFNNKQFDLNQFVDPNTGIISMKSKDGKTLKAQELPGLWNGSMADWNTIFVEVPIETFNPVKTINDLLRDQHQAE